MSTSPETVNCPTIGGGDNRLKLSRLQKAILELLPASVQVPNGFGGSKWSLSPLRNQDIIKRLGLPNAPSHRAAVSRSLDRLLKRKLAAKWVDTWHGIPSFQPGYGGRWTLPTTERGARP